MMWISSGGLEAYFDNIALSGYQSVSAGVAAYTDLSGISVSLDASALDYIVTGVVSGSSGSIVSGIGAWGDLRWSKIYGIPLEQWDALIEEV